LTFERTGKALCIILVLIFDEFNIHKINCWTIWLGITFAFMVLYLICWGRYFIGNNCCKCIITRRFNPRFYTSIGYLDNVILLPFFIALTLKLIPKETI